MAAFHQLNLYNTQDRQDQGLHSALHPSDFIFVISVNQSGLDQGKDSVLTNCFYLVLMLPNNLLILDQLPPIYHAAVPAPLNHFHPDSSSIAQPGHIFWIIGQARSCVQKNWPMPVTFLNTGNLQDSVSATSASCFRLHLGSATLVAGPRPTNTSEYSLTAIWEQYYREMH